MRIGISPNSGQVECTTNCSSIIILGIGILYVVPDHISILQEDTCI